MTKKQTTRKQDRGRIASGQHYEFRYAGKKSRKSALAVKKAVKKAGISRKRLERTLSRRKNSPASSTPRPGTRFPQKLNLASEPNVSTHRKTDPKGRLVLSQHFTS
jgi:hypothetical protein